MKRMILAGSVLLPGVVQSQTLQDYWQCQNDLGLVVDVANTLESQVNECNADFTELAQQNAQAIAVCRERDEWCTGYQIGCDLRKASDGKKLRKLRSKLRDLRKRR